ncbi:MAG: hypothetical protein GEU78_16535, partial [Actinobacteria bacterium]|nr:hypothetical protein [Actinomycetota bacterium]
MAETFDLDAARAARREAKGNPPSITFGGETFVLPLEIDMDTAEKWSLSNTDGLKALFGEEQYKRFRD